MKFLMFNHPTGGSDRYWGWRAPLASPYHEGVILIAPSETWQYHCRCALTWGFGRAICRLSEMTSVNTRLRAR